MPRTTVNIDKSVLDELKERAHREGVSLGQLVTSLLVQALRSSARREQSKPFRWHSRDLGPTRIDMSDWSKVKDFLYDEDDARYGYHH